VIATVCGLRNRAQVARSLVRIFLHQNELINLIEPIADDEISRHKLVIFTYYFGASRCSVSEKNRASLAHLKLLGLIYLFFFCQRLECRFSQLEFRLLSNRRDHAAARFELSRQRSVSIHRQNQVGEEKLRDRLVPSEFVRQLDDKHAVVVRRYEQLLNRSRAKQHGACMPTLYFLLPFLSGVACRRAAQRPVAGLCRGAAHQVELTATECDGCDIVLA